MKKLILIALVAIGFAVAGASRAEAGVSVGIGIGFPVGYGYSLMATDAGIQVITRTQFPYYRGYYGGYYGRRVVVHRSRPFYWSHGRRIYYGRWR